ncbi:MAG: hypothetical protein ABIJ47_03920 [Candidatus Bathyarchaeota archaeon]
MTQEARDLAVKEPQSIAAGDLLPILDPKAAERAYHTYLKLCQAILVPYDKRIVKDGVVVQESDYARIPQRKQVAGKWITEYVDAPKKSAWRKLGRFYGVSTEIVEKTKEPHPDGSYTWHYTVKATASGVTQDGEGSCTSTEKGGKSEHDTRATAHTRAKSRAISDLIGFGQVSAEEYHNYEEDAEPRKQVEAEAKPVEPERKGNAAPNTAKPETPIVDPAEETVKATLTANDLDTDHLLIVRYGNVVRVEPEEGFGVWDDYDRVLKLLKAKWSDEELRWEIPAKNLEHLTDAPGPEPEEPVYDIWAIDWKLKGGESAPRGTSWAWAFAYNDGDYIPEIKPLIQFIEQYGQLEAEGYTVTLGGRDKNLLNLKKNKKEAK